MMYLTNSHFRAFTVHVFTLSGRTLKLLSEPVAKYEQVHLAI